MSENYFTSSISRQIWESKYRFHKGEEILDNTLEDSWWRVANTLAAVEPDNQKYWAERFFKLMQGFKFLPGGRILAGAGTEHRVTLFNCFVMGTIEDSLDGIFTALKEGAITMQAGGGVGYDFSTLRPSGSAAQTSANIASGPVSFMHIWDAMCATLVSTGNRRGAMMATLRCDHPDIEAFIDAKRDSRRLRHFNLSVLVSDEFMRAVKDDADWPLVFPLAENEQSENQILRQWSAAKEPVPCKVHKVVSARELWDRLIHASYDVAEPGVLFIDRINAFNNLSYREQISATNPCGEIPLPAYGACNLGSINLTQFIVQPFTNSASMNLDAIADAVIVAVRLLDNVIDASQFPLSQQKEQAQGSRRIGLGISGLADALIMLGIHYDSEAGRNSAAKWMRLVCHTAYRYSTELAREKNAFPFFEAEKFFHSGFARALPREIREQIATHGLRNSHLLAIAPTGTISLLANNISSGIEPIFATRFHRKLRLADGNYESFEVEDYAAAMWRKLHPGEPLSSVFCEAQSLPPDAHLQMQAAIQAYVDNAISKTINIPADYAFNDYQLIYQNAYKLGLKGCTTYRPNPVTGAVLKALPDEESNVHCCSLERESA